jgi:AcrR family transcriptional regulator
MVFLARGYSGASMRAIASEAGVSLATLELLFGTKASLLKAAIDVAIAGDDDAVPVLERSWTDVALAVDDIGEFLTLLAGVIGRAQARSAGLIVAVFEGSSAHADLAGLAAQMMHQRRTTAEWIIDAMIGKTPLRKEYTRSDAVDTMWILMDPAVFDRLVRHCHWSVEHYQRWFAESARRLLVADVFQ